MRGWELMLSHDFRTGITTGFCKGTSSSNIVESMALLRGCGPDICHPLLFPLILFSLDASYKPDIKQRDARDQLRRLEHAISMRPEVEDREGYVKDEVVDLVECHSQVLWQRPIAYLRIAGSLQEAMDTFYNGLPEERKNQGITKTHASMLSRLEFYGKKWEGVETYASTTIERLEIQKSAVRHYPFL